MMRRTLMLLATGNALLLGAGCGGNASDAHDHGAADRPPPTGKPPLITWTMTDKVTKTDEEWRRTLTPEQYRILRRKGTERAFTGAYWDNHEPGVYACAGCGLALFSSEHKFDSGTGWPSYWQPLRPEQVATASDNTLFMRRTEILCARCNSHLGHVFDDGPRPTGLRYCINSAALTFAPGPTRAPGTTAEAGHADKPAPAP